MTHYHDDNGDNIRISDISLISRTKVKKEEYFKIVIYYSINMKSQDEFVHKLELSDIKSNKKLLGLIKLSYSIEEVEKEIKKYEDSKINELEDKYKNAIRFKEPEEKLKEKLSKIEKIKENLNYDKFEEIYEFLRQKEILLKKFREDCSKGS